MTNILIAEDQPRIAALMSRQFQAQGWNPIECHNGDDALRAMGAHRVDVVVTDSSLKTSDGAPILQRFRTAPRGEELPILLYSAMLPESGRELVLKGTVDAFVPKPAPLQKVIQEIRYMLGMDTVVTPADKADVLLVSPHFERWAAELAKARWTVEATRDPVRALELLNELRVAVLVVDLDIKLPPPEQIARTARKLSRGAEVRVVGVAAPDTASTALAEYDAVIAHDASPAAIGQAVARFLAR